MSASSEFRLQSKDVSLIQVSSQLDLTKAMLIVLRRLLADKITSLLLLSSSGTDELLRSGERYSVNLEEALSSRQLIIIDCVSKAMSEKLDTATSAKTSDGVSYVSSPSDLSEIARKVSDAITTAKPGGEKWLIIDSLTALAMYNSSGGILRFMQFLFKKLKMLNFDGVVVVVRDGDSESMMSELRRYCSSIIFLAGN